MSPGTRWRKRMKTRKSPIITQAAISSLDGRGLAGATTTGRGTIGLDVIEDDCKACVGQALSLSPDNLRGCPTPSRQEPGRSRCFNVRHVQPRLQRPHLGLALRVPRKFAVAIGPVELQQREIRAAVK